MILFQGLLSALVALISLFVSIPTVEAASSYFTFVPARFRSLELTLSARGLGEICHSRDAYPDGTVCNPAYLPEVRESQLVGRLYLGNGYTALSSADKFVNKPLTRDTMRGLFQGANVISVEAHAGLSFTAPNLSAGFSPYRVQYVSELRNPNLPTVSLHAAMERSFVVAGGTRLGLVDPVMKHFSFGAKLRIVERKFVHGQFSLFQATTEEPRDYLPSRKQTAFLLDPSFAWVGDRVTWKPRASIGVKNIGPAKPYFDEYPNNVDFEAGVGVEPPVRFGRVRVGLDLVDLMEAESFEDRLRLGGSYKVGLIETMLGANASVLTFGLNFSLNFLQTGVVYEYFRDDLGGGGAETRLSTEVVFRL